VVGRVVEPRDRETERERETDRQRARERGRESERKRETGDIGGGGKEEEEAVVNEPRKEGQRGRVRDGKVRRGWGTLQRRTCASRAKGPRDSSESVYDTGWVGA